MSGHDEGPAPTDRTLTAAPAGKSTAARYLFAVTASAVAVLAAAALLLLGEDPNYSPLIGAVAVTVWYGGLGPAIVACLLCWTLALWLLVEPRGSLTFGSTDDMTRWAVGLAVALLIVTVASVLRIGR